MNKNPIISLLDLITTLISCHAQNWTVWKIGEPNNSSILGGYLSDSP
ncbi:hypothetical protein SAMN04488514_12511 [Kriegella aquimaris]|uniref:Uncharacterized protein n=1 Tax=Kriegella aquimaris TaxID=192904 RepID=A0A1G9YPR1_9FLAO|nr:hypothetical protein SAMN04488514_12511 [Kriegella aquimaris]